MLGDPLVDIALCFYLCHGAEIWIMQTYDVIE